MVSWTEFQSAAPAIADEGRRLLYRVGEGAALLATVRDDAPPRIHPIKVGIVNEGLYAFLLDSPKRRDLELDGRFALHAHQDPAAPSEFTMRGHARMVESGDIRGPVAAEWYFAVDDAYRLFDFSIESALLGTRPSADSWPPTYGSWKAPPSAPGR